MAPIIDERFPSPPPLPAEIVRLQAVPERRRLRTETSATSGWAARLAQLFPDRSNAHRGSGRL